MPIAQGLGFGLLAARVLTRFNKNQIATSTVVLNYRASEERLSKSQCRDDKTVEKAKERMLLLKKNEQQRHYSTMAFKNNELKQRLGGYAIRRLHKNNESEVSRLQMTQKELEEALRDEKWVPVYRFPGILFCSFISKAKFIQTVASALAIPYITYLYAAGYQPLEFMVAGMGAAILAPLALMGFSMTFNRLVGVISMTESNEYIRIGYLSFFGTRRNMIIALEDFTPLSEVAEKPEKIVKVSRYSDPKDWFYLSTKGIQLVDNDRAKLLFGKLDYFKVMDMKVKKNE